MQFSLSLSLLKYQVLNLKILFSILSTGHLTVIWNNVKLILKMYFQKNLKNIVLAGDFNINVLDFETNKNVQVFLNLMFRYNMIPLTNKQTQVTSHSANAIDRIMTSSVTGHNDFKSAIIKTDLLDQFPVVFAIKTNQTTQRPVVKSTYKRSYCEKNIDKFKNILHNRNWDDIKELKIPTKHINTFLIPLWQVVPKIGS